MESGPFTLDELRKHEERMLREWQESFPIPGDEMFLPSPSGAHVDPFGFIDPSRPGERPLMGRWELYSQGFLEAGDRLVDSLRPDETATPPGAALIYPILFCYRHYLELQLKGLIFCVLSWWPWFKDIDQAKGSRTEDQLSKTHSLKALWLMFEDLYAEFDSLASEQDREAFKALLFQLDEHDPKAQASRYPTDVKGNQTLTQLINVDLGNVKEKVHKISRYLENGQQHVAEQMRVLFEAASGLAEPEEGSM